MQGSENYNDTASQSNDSNDNEQALHPSANDKPLDNGAHAEAQSIEKADSEQNEGYAMGMQYRVVPALQTSASVASLLFADQVLKASARSVGVQFPPQLLGMAAILACMLSFDAAGMDSISHQLRSALEPGISFISRWLPCFYAPSIVRLPVAIKGLGAYTICSMCAITVIGFVLTLSVAAAMTTAVRSITKTQADERPPQLPGKQYTALELGSIVSVGIAGLIIAAVYTGSVFMQRVGIGMAMFAATTGGYACGTLLPKKVQTVMHPLLVCALVGNATAWLCSVIVRNAWSYADILNGYVMKWKGGVFGGGDVLMLMLGPIILSFAFKVYDERETMRKHFAELVLGSSIASLFSLLVTPLAGRLLGLDPLVSCAIAPRSVTAALAAPAGQALGAPPAYEPITLAIVVLTGLVGGTLCVQLLNLLGSRDVITRGMATAASAHGVGTATLSAVEPSALPFCALTYVLSGVFASIFATFGPVQKLVHLFAGG